jgi:hypothetical protein
MSNAWETTADDVWNVINEHGIGSDLLHKMEEDGTMEEICDHKLDHDAIEEEALRSTDFDKQVELAYAEITRQLLRDGTLIND